VRCECADDCDTPRRGLPGSSSNSEGPIGFGDVAAHTDCFEIDERLIAVIALLADDIFDADAIGLHGLDLLGGFDQRLDARLRVALVRALDSHPDDRAGLEIDRMLRFVGQVRPPILHLRSYRTLP
jgi:hypothetical protein